MKRRLSTALMFFVIAATMFFVFPQEVSAATPTVKMGNVALKADAKWHAYNSKAPTISGWTAGKYRLSKDGKTLELNGVKYSGSKRGINSTAALTIKTTGTNTFTCKGARGIGLGADESLKNLTLTGASGSVLNLKCTDARAICVNTCTFSTITVNATGTVYCETNYNGSSGKMAVSGTLDVCNNATISGGTHTATGNIDASNILKVTGGIVTANKEINGYNGANIGGGTVTAGGVWYGQYITLTGGTITSKGNNINSGGNFSASGGTATASKGISVSENLTVSGANITASSQGVEVYGNLSVTKGSVTGKNTANENGIYVKGNSTVSGTGKIVATTGNSNAFNTQGTLTVTGGTVEASNSAVPNEEDRAFYNLYANNIIVKGGTITATANGKAGNAIGAEKTITVSGGSLSGKCTNTENSWPAITAKESIGVSGGTLTGTGTASCGIYTPKSFNLSGNATVNATSKKWTALRATNLNVSGNATVNATNKDGYALYATENLIVSGGQITAKSDNNNGIVAEAVTVSAGTVNGKGMYHGVHTNNLKISGGYVYGESQQTQGVYVRGSFEMTDGKLTGKTLSEEWHGGIRADSADSNISIADDIWVSTPSEAYTSLDWSDSYFAVYDSNHNLAKEATLQKVKDISVKTGPTTQMYREDYFNPEGISLDVTFADGSKSVLAYDYNTKDMFSFNIPEEEALSAGVKNLSINCCTKTATTSFTVKELEPPYIHGTTAADKVHLSWEPVEGTVYYCVYAKDDGESVYQPIKWLWYETSFIDENLSPGTTKEYYVVAKRWSTSGSTIESEKSNVLRLTTELHAPEIEVESTSYNSAKIIWNESEGAEKYFVYRVDASGNITELGSTEKTEYEDNDLTPGVEYTYYVVAAITSQNMYSSQSNRISATPMFSGGTNLTVNKKEQGYDLSWNPVEGATAYEVYRGNDARGARSLIATVEDTKYLDSSADIYTKYNYAVRALCYVEATGKTYYGQWSNVAVTVPVIKEVFTEREIDKAKVDKKIKKISKIKTTAKTANKQMIIDFEKVPGVYDYRVEYRKLGDKTWKKMWTGKKNRFIIRGMKTGQFLEFRFAAYKYRNGKLVRGEYSTMSRRWYKTTKAKVKSGKKSISVNIKKVKGANKYKVFYAEAGKSNKEKSVTSKSNKIKIKGLKKGKTYLVWYRPIKNLNGKDYQGIRLPKKVKVK